MLGSSPLTRGKQPTQALRPVGEFDHYVKRTPGCPFGQSRCPRCRAILLSEWTAFLTPMCDIVSLGLIPAHAGKTRSALLSRSRSVEPTPGARRGRRFAPGSVSHTDSCTPYPPVSSTQAQSLTYQSASSGYMPTDQLSGDASAKSTTCPNHSPAWSSKTSPTAPQHTQSSSNDKQIVILSHMRWVKFVPSLTHMLSSC